MLTQASITGQAELNMRARVGWLPRGMVVVTYGRPMAVAARFARQAGDGFVGKGIDFGRGWMVFAMMAQQQGLASVAVSAFNLFASGAVP
jgi:hypothetical protein